MNKIKVKVKLYATLRKYLPGTEIGEAVEFEISEGTTINELLDKIGVENKEIKITLINGVKKDLEYILKDGDLLVVFPPVGGG